MSQTFTVDERKLRCDGCGAEFTKVDDAVQHDCVTQTESAVEQVNGEVEK